MVNNVEQTPQKSGNKLLGTGLAGLLILAAFFSGVQLGRGNVPAGTQDAGLFSFFGPSSKPDTDADLAEFWRVWNIMEDKFVGANATGTPERIDRVRGAIAGLVASYGDPYTVYLPPEEASQFEQEISGNFSGVGMEVGIRDNLLTVIAPLPDTPADKAGILAGDVITKINDVSTERMSVDQAVRQIRGEKGTTVTLTLYRKGENDFMTKEITRDVINIPTLETEVSDDVFIIKLYSFNALAEVKMREALEQYSRGSQKKLVLDLRGNPGGFLESSVSIAGMFLPAGKVIVRENFGEGADEQVYRSQGKQIVNVDPNNFVILIDGGSASASEILAGALSEHKVATTVGENTFGKGSVQELVAVPGGSSVKVTIARWLTPDGVSFSDGGLAPNVLISRTPQQVVAGEDPQKAAALEWLQGKRDLGEKIGLQF